MGTTWMLCPCACHAGHLQVPWSFQPRHGALSLRIHLTHALMKMHLTHPLMKIRLTHPLMKLLRQGTHSVVRPTSIRLPESVTGAKDERIQAHLQRALCQGLWRNSLG